MFKLKGDFEHVQKAGFVGVDRALILSETVSLYDLM